MRKRVRERESETEREGEREIVIKGEWESDREREGGDKEGGTDLAHDKRKGQVDTLEENGIW